MEGMGLGCDMVMLTQRRYLETLPGAAGAGICIVRAWGRVDVACCSAWPEAGQAIGDLPSCEDRAWGLAARPRCHAGSGRPGMGFQHLVHLLDAIYSAMGARDRSCRP